MQMRHQPPTLRKSVDQVTVGLDRVDGRQAQPLELRHMLEDLLHQRTKLRRSRQIGAIARDVDAGEHDLAIAVADEALNIADHRAHRHRA